MTTMTRAKPLAAEASNIADHAAETATAAIRSTQHVANTAFDRMSDSVEGARDRASPLIDRWSSQAEAAARRSVDAVRERALQASTVTTGYIKDEPLKAVLIAAAAGAALMAVISVLRGRRYP
jgi:ElaB/YqjD/DUF883 family membrane-anchored ribosome-binding protein